MKRTKSLVVATLLLLGMGMIVWRATHQQSRQPIPAPVSARRIPVEYTGDWLPVLLDPTTGSPWEAARCSTDCLKQRDKGFYYWTAEPIGPAYEMTGTVVVVENEPFGNNRAKESGRGIASLQHSRATGGTIWTRVLINIDLPLELGALYANTSQLAPQRWFNFQPGLQYTKGLKVTLKIRPWRQTTRDPKGTESSSEIKLEQLPLNPTS